MGGTTLTNCGHWLPSLKAILHITLKEKYVRIWIYMHTSSIWIYVHTYVYLRYGYTYMDICAHICISEIWIYLWHIAVKCSLFMNNLTYHFSTCYIYFRVKSYRELNLVRALDARVFSFYLSTGSDSCFWEFHPSSVTLGIFVFFLIFCESLAHVF